MKAPINRRQFGLSAFAGAAGKERNMEKYFEPETDEIITQAAAREIRDILIKNGLFNDAPYLVQRWLINNDGVDHSSGESEG